MSAAIAIAALWFAFAATHLLLSSRALRPKLVRALGAQGFQGIYSLLALALFVPLVSVYFTHQHDGPFLWYLGAKRAWRWAAYLGMGVSLTLLVGGLIRPSAASMGAAADRVAVTGMLRLTRHPVVMAMGLFGLVHLFAARVHAAELAFFAGFPIWAAVGCRHQDQRKLADQPESYGAFVAQTAFWPFSRGGLVAAVREGALAVAIGIVLAVVVRYFHPSWFGGA